MKNVLIADNHKIIRTGIRHVLKEHFPEADILEAGSIEEISELMATKEIHVMLIDQHLAGAGPDNLVVSILKQKPETGVIICSQNKEEVFGLMYMRMGALGYLRKSCRETELVSAVRCAFEGLVYMPRELQQLYLGNVAEPEEISPFSVLTRKELEVLRYIARGESMNNICKIMNISRSTAGTHKSRLFEKLHITNLLELRSITEMYPL